MKTHDFADALMILAKAIRNSANVELKDMPKLFSATQDGDNSSALALSLSTMTLYAQVSKDQWRKKIVEWKLPVPIKPSDSARDLFGRLSQYLRDNPDAWRKLHKEAASKNRKVSAELMETLAILLGDDEGEQEGKKESGKK